MNIESPVCIWTWHWKSVEMRCDDHPMPGEMLCADHYIELAGRTPAAWSRWNDFHRPAA